MRRNPLVLVWLVLGVVCFFSQSWAACPEDPNDNGACDTLHVDIWPGDEEAWPPWPNLARFPIRVTNDIPNPNIDSVAGFIIPLCYIHSNPSKYCSLSSYWNNTMVYYPSPGLDRSIFRHMPDMETAEEFNWLMLLPPAPCWDTRILDLDGTSHFWLSLVPTGTQDQRFGGGSRVLTATMTFKMEDTATICIDTCFAGMMRLAFSRSDAVTYIPRHHMPVCQYVGYTEWPPPVWFSTCPVDESRNSNETFSTAEFVVESSDGDIVQASPQFAGTGITDVGIAYDSPPPGPIVTGTVQYTVQDHCQDGGTIAVTAWDDMGLTGECVFDIVLSNSPPEFGLFDTWRALSGYTMTLHVPASDVDGDAVEVATLDGFWYEPDSLQSPINPPSFDAGNPALLTWVPDESETGNWICSFTAFDACGAGVTHQLTIQVGTPYCGDCTGDGDINLGDVVYLIGYLYKQGPPPDPLCRGDVNADGSRDVGDVVLLINYLFKSSFAPCFDCCP